MEQKPPSRLPYHRETYRLWFEYLRVAKKSERQDVKDALKRSASFYAPWGDVLSERFDVWWKKNGHLFEQRNIVRQLRVGELPSDPQALIVEIPLNRSTTKLTKAVKALIEQAWKEREKQGKRKNKTVASSSYSITEGAEPKLRAVREMLTVYRDVHLKNPALGGYDLLRAVQNHYKNRKQKRWAKIPMALTVAASNNPELRNTAMRNLRRYITKAETVTLNVARGEFPGRY